MPLAGNGSASRSVVPGYDVAIIGAGAAGLAAAAVLRHAGLHCILIEAAGRIGGRAHTVRPAVLGGARFDTGATWLHQTDRNPLVALARAHGIALAPAHQGPHRLFVGGRPARPDEVRAYDEARTSWEQIVLGRIDGPDMALAEAAGSPGFWTASIENWEGAIIAAADADQLGLHDWHRNQLDDNDLSPPDGVGTLLADLLGPMAGPVQSDTPVRAIDWRDTTWCSLHTANLSCQARSVIVTVSTGVLRAGSIAFDPPLPARTRAAIDGLPMGLLNKLALPASGLGRLGLDAGTLLESRIMKRGGSGMLLSAWPSGLPYVSAFYGGRHARSLDGQPQAALAEAHGVLCALLGPQAGDAVDKAAGFVTDWASDPLFLGAYAYAPPGQAHQRARLAEPVGDGQLVFAGEACRSDGLAGTVGGALADGERAAHLVLERRFGRNSSPGLLQAHRNGFPKAPNPV